MFTKISKHSDLMGRMAERAGVDIGAEVLDGSFGGRGARHAIDDDLERCQVAGIELVALDRPCLPRDAI